MYFPLGWPQTLAYTEPIDQIVANSDHTLFVLLSSQSLSLWYCRPSVQIVQYQRTSKSIQQYGYNVKAVWRSDSSQIVVQTSQDYLLYYHVIFNEQHDILLILEPKNGSLPNESFAEENRVPSLVLELQHKIFIDEGITSIMSAEEEVVVSTTSGSLCGVDWDGQIDENFCINISVPQNYHQKKEEQANPYYITDFKYSTIIDGFSLVFSNGLAAFLPLNDNTSNYTQLQLIGHVDNAVCTAINHKYAFIVFGLISSEAVICGFDEVDHRFIVSYRLSLPANTYPDADKMLGPLTALQWTPDSSVLATAWENGGFALWSVFGSLLSCSLSWNYSLDIESKFNSGLFKVSSLAFSKEGFHLWMATKHKSECDETSVVCRLALAKSVLAANASSSVSLESVLLCSEDRLFIGGNKNSSLIAQIKSSDIEANSGHKSRSSEVTSSSVLSDQESNAVDSFQWITVSMPHSYLEENWPVRFFAIDPLTSQNIAIAGATGFAMYSLLNRRWKLFGNENHERDVIVTGGFLWFYDFLIAGCYNISSNRFEIRAYSHRNKLDNAYAKITQIENEVHLLSLHRNRLLALCSNGSIFLFDLHLFKRNHHHSHDQNYEINISAPIRVIINNMEIFADCVTVCLLTDLHVDMYHSALFQSESSHRSHLIQSSATARSHSILINICGRVLLLEMDIDTTGLPLSSDTDDDDSDASRRNSEVIAPSRMNGHHGPSSIKFRKAVKIASNVENLWLLPHDEAQLNAFRPSAISRAGFVQQRPHLVTSLYLSCGAQGMAIWLALEHSTRPQHPTSTKERPLVPNENEHTYISKRIMLSLSEMASSIYPLAVRFREAIVLGAESDFTQLSVPSLSSSGSVHMPFCLVKRTSQVYLHYILRELLRRNLGYRAWEIANTCSTLPHFVHSLELLLHGVLEEEAGSSQPIPDALLPRVVDFIRAFPVFLQTVIHCARKTELSLWPHLFSIVGSPKDLFQQCLLDGQLETASSYIIVLQNLEKPEVATKCASRLLQAARIAGCWVTVKELKRFLRATNHTEEQSQPAGQPNGGALEVGSSSSQAEELSSSLSSQCKLNEPTVAVESSAKAEGPVRQRSNSSLPGAAIKENGTQANGYIEQSVLMRQEESDHDYKEDECSSISNSEENVKAESELMSCQSKLTNGNGVLFTGRAYPGTILRMSYDATGNQSFKWSAEPIFPPATASTSSISSVSSALSSASVSPIVHPNDLKANSHLSAELTNGGKSLRAVALTNGESGQCVIS